MSNVRINGCDRWENAGPGHASKPDVMREECRESWACIARRVGGRRQEAWRAISFFSNSLVAERD